MDLMSSLSFIAVASLLVMSPGPNGLLIAKTVPISGKMAGFANVAGFVAAFHFHGALSILGISAILLASTSAFFIVKILGAAYLCWIGVRALRDAFFIKHQQSVKLENHSNKSTSSNKIPNETKISPLLTDLLNRSLINRWPQHMLKEMDVFLKAERHLQKRMDSQPTAEDIAVECGSSVNDVRRLLMLRDRILSSTGGIDPDVGVPLYDCSMFYLAAFPQFIAIGEGTVASAYMLVLLHTLINVAWFGAMVILFARLAAFTNKGSFQRWLKGVTGIVFIGFGVKLAAS